MRIKYNGHYYKGDRIGKERKKDIKKKCGKRDDDE
jgi:hypothetical protein